MSILEKKIIFPSTPVPGIDNDQSLNYFEFSISLILEEVK